MTQSLISLKNITKSFGDQVILNDINLEVKKNDFITLLGPSGCGKTTTLRIIGGFESPDNGQVYFNNKIITQRPPHKRSINTVFQKYALFTHLNVYENIAFGLKIKKLAPDLIKKKVDWALNLVNLKGYEKRNIHQLSGGQQQRIAIARAIVNEPEVLLLDEPLGALDLKLRKEMQYELKELQRTLGITFIYVTHDQEEALTMSSTVVVMNDGIIQQAGSPQSIYNEPKNAFVADFIGESNIFPGIMLEDFKLEMFEHKFDCVDKGFSKNEAIEVVIRPEDVDLVKAEAHLLTGQVVDCIFKGVHYETYVMIKGIEWMIHSTKSYVIGSEVSLYIEPELIHIMKKGS
jgi:spermidine/putrescine transport system ATP-binding protein